MATETGTPPSRTWYDTFSGTCAWGRDFATSSLQTLSQTMDPRVWSGMGVISAIGSAAQFAKGSTVAGITGLWASLGSAWMSVLGGATREEAEATVHASTLALGGALAIDGIQGMTSGRAPNAPRSFFSSATGQLLAGAGIIYGALKAGPRMTTYMSCLGTTAMTGALFMKFGIHQISKGKYLSGLGYTAAGAAGIAGSAYTAYLMLAPTDPTMHQYEDFSLMDSYLDTPQRRVRVATVYNNHGDPDREAVSKVVVENQDEYARLRGYEREVIPNAELRSRCWADTAHTVETECNPHFLKLEYAVDRCKDPNAQGTWIVVMSDNMPVTNPNIDLMRAIDQLRTLPDGRVVPAKMILTQEAGDWPSICNEDVCFKPPGIPLGTHHPKTAINSGLMMFEAQAGSPQCRLLESALEHRNTRINPEEFPVQSPLIAQALESCHSLGVCEFGKVNIADQTALSLALQEGYREQGEDFFHSVVHVVPQRDEANKYRSHIALNTLWRGGCYQPEGAPLPFDIGDFDRREENRYGIWREGDFSGQPAGIDVRGKYHPRIDGQACALDSSQEATNPRLRKVEEMLALKEKPIRWTFMMTHTDKPQDVDTATTGVVRPNHQLMAYRHRGKYVEDTSPMQLVATHPFKGKDGTVYEPCLNDGVVVPCSGRELHSRPAAPYWRKVDFSKRWVHEPISPEFTDILVYADNDLVYDPNLDLYQMWKWERKGNQAPFLVAADDHSISVTNTGFFMFERSPETRELVDHWAQGVNWPALDGWGKGPLDPNAPTLGYCGASQTTSLHEQTALNRMMEKDPTLRDRTIKVISLWDESRPYGAVNALCREGHWQAPRDWYNDIEYHDPDWLKPKPGQTAVMQPAGVPKIGRDFGEPESRNRPIRREVLIKAMEEHLTPLKFMPIYDVGAKHQDTAQKVDRFFYVNLDGKTARQEHMERMCSSAGIACERFSAVNGRALDVDQLIAEGKYRPHPVYASNWLKPSELGVALSHQGIWQRVARDGTQAAVIMEDDVSFSKEFQAQVNSLLRQAPKDWDLLYLGCNANQPDQFFAACRPENSQLTPDRKFTVVSENCIAGNWAYVVSQKGAQELSSHLFPLQRPVDYMIAEKFLRNGRLREDYPDQRPLNAYCATPEIVQTGEFASTIGDRGNCRDIYCRD